MAGGRLGLSTLSARVPRGRAPFFGVGGVPPTLIGLERFLPPLLNTFAEDPNLNLAAYVFAKEDLST